MTDAITQYLVEVQHALRSVSRQEVARVIEILLEANRARRQVFLLGNGGSAATASHFACDLGKGAIVSGLPRFRVVALTDNVPLMTAWANDTTYENIFAQQLAGLVQAGDVVIGISGSGNSANVLNAVRLARDRAATTVGLTGFDGGQLRRLVDVCLHVPAFCMEQVEDVHLVLAHLLCTRVRAALRETADSHHARAWPASAARDRVVQSLVEQLTRSLGVTISSVLTLDTRRDALIGRAASPINYLEARLPIGARIPLRDVPTHYQVIKQGRPVLFRQTDHDPAVPPAELELTLAGGLKSGALLPLRANGGFVGVIALGERRTWERSPFTEKKLERGLALVSEWAPILTDWYATTSGPDITDQGDQR